jgi:Transglycosylase SLT domain
MSIAPRTGRKRRSAVREGRERLLLLAAAASVAGALGPVATADSQSTDPCSSQTGVVTVQDGQSVCAPTTTSPQTTDPAPEDTTSAGTEVPPQPPAGDTGAPSQTPPPTDTAPPPGDTVPTDSAQPERPSDEPTPSADQTVPDTSEPAPAPTPAAAVAPSKPLASPAAPAGAVADTPAKADHKPHRRTKRHRSRASHGSEPPRPHDETAHGRPRVPQTTFSVPAEWTSLDPIILPPFSLADFPVPAYLLPLYQAAGAEYSVPWEVLAAINSVETDYGRNMAVSSAGALGFMQFMPATWAEWGRDADGDRRRDPDNPVDAIFSAARYLHAAGATDDLSGALFAYNHAAWYVDRVLARARELAGLDQEQVAALTARALDDDNSVYQVKGSPFFGPGTVDPTAGQILLMTVPELTRRVLHDDRIDLYSCGREDIEAGRIDRRVLATLLFLAESGFHLQISSLECGHGVMTTSGNVSAHSYGAAVDIASVDGTPIAGHQGPGSITERVLHRLLDLQGFMRPDQIISLMTVEGVSNTLALPDHDDHIHVGFPRATTLETNAEYSTH